MRGVTVALCFPSDARRTDMAVLDSKLSGRVGYKQ